MFDSHRKHHKEIETMTSDYVYYLELFHEATFEEN